MKASANPLPTSSVEWVPLRAGVSMRPLHFEKDGYALQLKVEPGTTIARHRHSGQVHALNISGYRQIIDTGEIVGPGDYVYEPRETSTAGAAMEANRASSTSHSPVASTTLTALVTA